MGRMRRSWCTKRPGSSATTCLMLPSRWHRSTASLTSLRVHPTPPSPLPLCRSIKEANAHYNMTISDICLPQSRTVTAAATMTGKATRCDGRNPALHCWMRPLTVRSPPASLKQLSNEDTGRKKVFTMSLESSTVCTRVRIMILKLQPGAQRSLGREIHSSAGRVGV